jgi:hypothetical protein
MRNEAGGRDGHPYLGFQIAIREYSAGLMWPRVLPRNGRK